MKTKFKVGDEGFMVEWCANLPKDENGDSDYDHADYRVGYFRERDKAIAYAKKVAAKDAFGQAILTPVRYVDEIGEGNPLDFDWVTIGNDEAIEADAVEKSA